VRDYFPFGPRGSTVSGRHFPKLAAFWSLVHDTNAPSRMDPIGDDSLKSLYVSQVQPGNPLGLGVPE